LKVDEAPEYRSYGIEKLLSDGDETIALTPINGISYKEDYKENHNE
jgi:hypothetical protein